jgi:arsenate reductase
MPASTRERVYRALFLCTGNSARSLMAECALTRHGAGRFIAHSAGSHPAPAPHPLTLETLREMHYAVDGLRSKSWEEFSGPGAPDLDFVFTVCDAARGEACPVWPGRPMTAHWGVEDPVAFEGPLEERRRRFRIAYFELEQRIRIFTQLPIESLDRLTLQARLDGIGKTSLAPPPAARGD